MKKKWIIEVITVLLIILWVYAATGKLLEYQVFVAQLHTHPMLNPFAGFLAWALPATEFIVSALLVVPKTRLIGLYCTAGLLLSFTIYLMLMLLSGKDLPCSCSGIVSALNWGQHIVFNLVFMFLAIIGILAYNKKIFYRVSAKKAHSVRAV